MQMQVFDRHEIYSDVMFFGCSVTLDPMVKSGDGVKVKMKTRLSFAYFLACAVPSDALLYSSKTIHSCRHIAAAVAAS